MTSSGCSAGWLACTNSAAKLRNASSTYARRPLSACSQRIFNPHFSLRLGLISHLELVCSGQRRHLQLYDNCAVADDQWYWQGRFSTMQSITQRTILAIFLQVTPPLWAIFGTRSNHFWHGCERLFRRLNHGHTVGTGQSAQGGPVTLQLCDDLIRTPAWMLVNKAWMCHTPVRQGSAMLHRASPASH
jgi:hypothetical protein